MTGNSAGRLGRQLRGLRRLTTAATLLSALLLARPGPAQVARQTIEHDDDLDYLLYLPNGHDPSKKWPLILFLHGFGERSSENAEGEPFSALTVHSMPAVVESDDWDWPFIVVSPQIDDEGWISRAGDLGALVERMQAEHGADPNRLYLTGLSYGGRGTWEVGLLQLGRWAALMPLCSDPTGLDASDRASLSTRPIFVVHGTQDPTDNDYATMDAFIAAFASEGTPFFEFEYAWRDQEDDLFPREVLGEPHVFARMIAYGHDVWTATYGRRNASFKTVSFDWLLARSLDGSEFVDPRDPSYESVIAERERAAAAEKGDAGCSTSPPSRQERRRLPWLGLAGAPFALLLRRASTRRGSPHAGWARR